MACEQWRDKLDAYQDGELSPQDLRDLETHLRSCPSCASAVLERVKLRRGMQAAGRRYAPSAEFRLRVLRTAAGRSRRSIFWMAAPAAAMAVVVVAVSLLAHQARQRERRDQALAELVDLHVTTLASANPLDVVSSDRHTVKPWFQGRIPFTFNLPDLTGTEFLLSGARVCYFGQSPGAQLIFQKQKHQISVFIIQDGSRTEGMPDQAALEKVQFRLQTWRSAGLRFFVVGDAAPVDIEALSSLLQQANRS